MPTPEQIELATEIVHEAVRVVQRHTGEEVAPPWADAPQWMKDSTARGVKGAMEGNTPEKSHQQWLEERLDQGWTLGPEKDTEAKISPNLVNYASLPDEQKIKDHLVVAITKAVLQEA